MDHVPVIDLDAPADLFERAIDHACREWGFFQIVAHGIDMPRLAALEDQMHRFFEQSTREKQRVGRDATNVWGFYDQELTKNRRDWKEIFDVGPAESTGPLAGSAPRWPEGLDGFRETLEGHAKECRRVGGRLLEAIARNLGIAAESLLSGFEDGETSFLRLNYYPVCPDPAPADTPTDAPLGQLGISHHTDAGALTILYQDEQPGLQVYREGGWHTVVPRRDALVINIGDIVQVWSNDLYRAPLHRVLANADQPRFSAPFFMNPSYETNYAPLVGEPRYRPINWGEFRAGRAAGDYADLGEEIQIDHFRIARRESVESA